MLEKILPSPTADEAIECPVCSHFMAVWLSGLSDDRYGYPGLFTLRRCHQCGLVETWPQLRNEELPALYSTYYPRRMIEVETLPLQLTDPESLWGRLRIWLAGTGNQGHHFARVGMRVLDYGCGAGTSLMELQHLGAVAYGIEVDTNVNRVADRFGLKIHIGSLADHPFPGLRFDLISLNQVIEHVPDPSDLLSGLSERLEEGGSIALSFPNVDSIYRRLFGRRWINWHVPYHLHHFCRRSFSELCRRDGWDIVGWRTVTPNVWTALQVRALFRPSSEGTPNPMWASTDARNAHQRRLSPSQRSVRALRRAAKLGIVLMGSIAATITNRLVDAMGMGDSCLVLVRRTSPTGDTAP